MTDDKLSTEHLQSCVSSYEEGDGEPMESFLEEGFIPDRMYNMMVEILRARSGAIKEELPDEIEIAGVTYIKSDGE